MADSIIPIYIITAATIFRILIVKWLKQLPNQIIQKKQHCFNISAVK